MGTAFAAAAMFAPLLAVLVVRRLDGERLLSGVGGRLRWSRRLLLASAIPLALAALALGLGVALPGVVWDPSMEGMFERYGSVLTEEQIAQMRDQIDLFPIHPLWLAWPQALVAGFTINALFAFGEEVGWRGWLHRELAPLGFWRASAATGLLWGLWHAPFVLQGHNYPEHRVIGVALFTGVCVLLSPLLSWVRQRADTVWAAAVFHGTYNAAAGITLMTVRGPKLLVGFQGLAGVLALLGANAILLSVVGRRPERWQPPR